MFFARSRKYTFVAWVVWPFQFSLVKSVLWVCCNGEDTDISDVSSVSHHSYRIVYCPSQKIALWRLCCLSQWHPPPVCLHDASESGICRRKIVENKSQQRNINTRKQSNCKRPEERSTSKFRTKGCEHACTQFSVEILVFTNNLTLSVPALHS